MMMMMSIFSPFDVLFAESFGQKVSPAPCNKLAPAMAAGKIDDLKKEKDVSCSSQPSAMSKKPEEGKRMRAPRFALELDGVHCFENILPY